MFQMSGTLLYHLLAYHSLWWAPIYAWLLLVSAWARRAPFLWAVLPPMAIAVVEKIAFNTSHFASLLARRFSGGGQAAGFEPGNMAMVPLTQLGVGHSLVSPGLVVGPAGRRCFSRRSSALAPLSGTDLTGRFIR